MNAVSRVLVIGGGPVGNALTVLLRRGGIEVDLVEKDPRWATLGAGITLPHNALRVLNEVGVLDAVLEHGAPEPHTHGVPQPGHDGSSPSFVSETPLVDCGLYRPKLQEILIDAVRASGADVRLGTTAVSLEQSGTPGAAWGDDVQVSFTDGTSSRYDLVVGADGMHSATRSMLGIDLQPTPMGIGAWRIYTRRPASVRGFKMYRSGPCHVAGIRPTSRDHLYAYLVEDARIPDPPREDRVEVARELLAGYGEWQEWRDIRESLTSPEQIDCRRFSHLLVDRPWHRGRVVLIGDAAHSHPPTLTQGAAMGLEDASVLAELLTTHEHLDAGVLDAFTERRFGRVSAVVDASVRLADMNRGGAPDGEWTALWDQMMQLVAAPA